LGEVEAKLRDLRHRVNFLKPDVTIPFASFIYFCNEENKWLNDFAITPRRVMAEDLPGVNFMYPDDEWDSEVRQFRCAEAVERYMDDIARRKVIDPTPAEVPLRTVQQSADRTLRMLRSRFGKYLINRINPFSIYLHDLGEVLLVNPAATCEVLEADQNTRASARYVMCSQLAWFAFAYSWGWAAMDVSGMYTDLRCGEPNALAFYLNLVATECLMFRTPKQAMRTISFLWAKRWELVFRLLARFRGNGRQTFESENRRRAIA